MTAVDPAAFGAPGSFDRPVRHVRTVAGSPGEVFHALTDAGELGEWLGVPASVDLEVGGGYELLFDDDQPIGLQGSEGCQVLAFVPGRLLVVTWNSPPALMGIRNSHTFVAFILSEAGAGTEVELVHAGHGKGDIWDENRRYFERAWGMVLDALEARFPLS